MQRSEKTEGTDRRGFLKLLGTGAATGAATLTAAVAPSEAAAPEQKDGLYRETQHVKTYYELAKF